MPDRPITHTSRVGKTMYLKYFKETLFVDCLPTLGCWPSWFTFLSRAVNLACKCISRRRCCCCCWHPPKLSYFFALTGSQRRQQQQPIYELEPSFDSACGQPEQAEDFIPGCDSSPAGRQVGRDLHGRRADRAEAHIA